MYAETKWINYTEGFEGNPPPPKLKLNISLISEKFLKSKNPKIRTFFLDETDVENVESEMKKCKNQEEKDKKSMEVLSNLSNFMKIFKKQIYLRTIPDTQIGFNKNRFVFLHEALESIPLALKFQNLSNLENGTKDFEMYSKQMGPLEELDTLMTIKIEQFEEMLTAFNVDKRQITIITDPTHEPSRRQIYETGKVSGIFSPDSRIFLDKSRAIFLIFQNLIMGVNWQKNDNWILKSQLLEFITEVSESAEGTYHSESSIRHKIQNFKKFYVYSNESENSENLLLQNSHPSAEVPISEYEKNAKRFDLPIFSNFSKNPKNLKIWMARFFLNLGWIFAFFKKNEHETEQLREEMLKIVLFLVPDPRFSNQCAQFLVGKLKKLEVIFFLEILIFPGTLAEPQLWKMAKYRISKSAKFSKNKFQNCTKNWKNRRKMVRKVSEKVRRLLPKNPEISIEMKDLKTGKR
ncbi:Protein CBG24166 [Caenorhabditis briggsae]|uniref:Protein CBG24166 n=1 Tax=Caenorhabditis briggsae TaxID=6238 RepID=A8WK43_CAEBR|nr:Protein CBG24166 [Caenorhabditis briggsae]CAP20836.2 Protein CBG24166 [Caenorhabditis briggsae]